MDFDQWKPLTGRGDPLRNDPTYDYEPPVLEKVHYWADDSRIEREKNPERKSEVLVLGVSSRKPSVASRPPPPPKRFSRPPLFPSKYEDFSYKFGDNFPMTILVPPPPPPPGHSPSSFILSQETLPTLPSKLSMPDATTVIGHTTAIPELITSYALQEANLVFQSSTTKTNWFHDYNKTTNFPNNTVSSDYAGWGPTTPLEDVNDSHNLISYKDHHNVEFTKEPLLYYKPVLSEAPPPPQASTSPLMMSFFLPTALPPTHSNSEQTWPSTTAAAPETTTETANYFTETTTEQQFTESIHTTPKPLLKPKPNIIDMLGSMISMPMITDRPEDNLYAHASDTIQIFQEPSSEDVLNLEKMQTMQPPPPVKFTETSTPQLIEQFNINPHVLNNKLHEKPVMHTHDPYLHMRYTTPMPATTTPPQDTRPTTEAQSLPAYLIIQGHSKVKTYGSKPKESGTTLSNEIPHPNETTEVKHLHPIKDKYAKKTDKTDKNRQGRTQNLKALVDSGIGSIEIQEADLGIKYDVSDGGEVPIEIYRKGIVDNDENNYSKSYTSKENRNKRQLDLESMLPFDEDSLEDLVFNYFDGKKNETGVTGLIAQVIADDSGSYEDDDENDQKDDTNR